MAAPSHRSLQRLQPPKASEGRCRGDVGAKIINQGKDEFNSWWCRAQGRKGALP